MRMRKHLVPTLLAAILVALPAAAEFDAAAFDKYVQQSMQAWRTPGVAVAIVQNGEVVHARGYGVREAGSPEPVDTRTLFGIGSCSKAFTTTALALLVEEGKLRWNDRVVDHLPWFQLYDAYVTSEFTISDLVTHRSGLATFSGDMLVFGSTYGREEIVRRARHLEPVAGFRSQFGYQNLMYVAAGLVLEELTRDSWDAFIDERIFTPLGMSDSNTSVTALARGGNVAMPHIEIEGEITPIEYWNVDNAAPAGSINSNVTDMARWIQVLLASGAIDDEHRLFSDASATRMWTVHTPRGQGGYGLGWALAHHEGSRRVSHDGGLPGMVVEVALLPDEQVGVVVLSNAMSGLPAALVGRVLDTYTAAEERDLSALMLEGFTRYEEAKRQAWIQDVRPGAGHAR
jgi:CubicO group peptidase (beta-lactamase class C family)